MNGRTELTAAITAILNGVFGVLDGLGIWQAPPELIAGINGVLGPLIIYFLAIRVTRVENAAGAAQTNSAQAATNAVQAKNAAQTASAAATQVQVAVEKKLA